MSKTVENFLEELKKTIAKDVEIESSMKSGERKEILEKINKEILQPMENETLEVIFKKLKITDSFKYSDKLLIKIIEKIPKGDITVSNETLYGTWKFSNIKKFIKLLHDKTEDYFILHAINLCKNKIYAKDLTQETWMKIIKRRAYINENFIGYFLTVQKRLFLDNKSKPKKIFERIENSIPQKEEIELLREIPPKYITRLPPKQKIVIVLTLQGYNQKAIAKALEISTSAVNQRMKNAVINLIKYMKEDGGLK